MADNLAEIVESDEFSEWCKAACTIKDVLDVLDMFKGKDVYLKGWDFNVKITGVDADAVQTRLQVSLEAYCQKHPEAKHSKNFIWNPSADYAGEFLYECFLDMITPFRQIHPFHPCNS